MTRKTISGRTVYRINHTRQLKQQFIYSFSMYFDYMVYRSVGPRISAIGRLRKAAVLKETGGGSPE
jgi:hypothetical protein